MLELFIFSTTIASPGPQSVRKIASRPPCARLIAALPALIAALAAAPAAAAPLTGPARSAIEKFIRNQTAGLPGKVTVSVDAPATSPLPPCAVPEPFLPQGAAPWGRLSVGIRCPGERPWTRFVAVQVAVEGSYFVAAAAIDAGRALSAQDFVERRGDLARLPRSVVTDAAQLEGMIAANRIAAQAPLRKEMLRGAIVIQQGQVVRLVAQGDGFLASTQGKAMTRAAVGAAVQVKTDGGRLVGGVATQDGQVTLAQ